MLFKNKKILNYIFTKLKAPNQQNEPPKGFGTFLRNAMKVSQNSHTQETIRLATLALSRLSSKFDEQALKEQQIESEFFQRALGKDNFDNFDHMLNYV